MVSLPPFSGRATATVVVTGGLAALWGGLRRRSRRTRPGAVGPVAPWALVAVAGAGWQLAAYLQHPRADHPTLSSLANALLDSHPARALAFVLWVLAAVELGRR